jgi:hypothetical protein
VENVGPFEPVDLRATQAGVEGEGIREGILGGECLEELLSFGGERDTKPWPLVVRRKLDQPTRIPRDVATRRRHRPGVDRRGDGDER